MKLFLKTLLKKISNIFKLRRYKNLELDDPELQYMESILNSTYIEYIDVLENQIEQNRIDYYLNFVSEDIYKSKCEKILAQIKEIKSAYQYNLDQLYFLA